MPNSDDPDFHIQYIAHLIQVDEAKHRDELLPLWGKTDATTKAYYMKLANMRLEVWQQREAE